MKEVDKSKIGVIGLKGLPAYGGAAAVGENIIANLANEFDFTIYAVSSHTNLKSGYFRNSFQIVFRKLPFEKINAIFYYLRSALDALLFRKYDLIHLHHRDASFVIPLLKLRYPIIVTTHGMVLTSKWVRYKFLFEFEDRYFLKHANFITTVSLKDQRIVGKLLPKEKLKYIPNGVNTNIKIETEKKDYISFAAGRMLPDKGCHTFLEALDLLERRENAVIMGDLKQNLIYKKELLRLKEKVGGVRFIGLIKDKRKLFEIIFSSKFFVFPSVNESMSMMLLEVAALKVPIICSDIPENRDVFGDEEVLFFKVNNVKDLSEKIRYASEHPGKMKVFAMNAYQRLQTSYLWSKIAEEYKCVFEKFINGK
ncbi:glycosyltransferase family 4 protein [Ancylomarina longa]|uniref:Glycosyltransferase n=1 Tax=Ancylomarina longa TaxID=2487017 RepID=A0A434AZ31_9BACT|nr:glycosyltransferase family 4 protein [Ancylomarina longa]RUT79878.1 glycosyltransferase [Ancylomarina longa]